MCSSDLFWYLRNFIQFGNPLGDYVRVELGSLILFPGRWSLGALRATTLASTFNPVSLRDWGILYEAAKSHLHVPFVALLLQGAILPLALFSQVTRVTKKRLLALMALLAATLVLYFTTPFSANNWADLDNPANSSPTPITPWIEGQIRFALPFFALLGVAAAAGLSVFRAQDEVVTAIVLISAALAILNSPATIVYHESMPD